MNCDDEDDSFIPISSHSASPERGQDQSKVHFEHDVPLEIDLQRSDLSLHIEQEGIVSSRTGPIREAWAFGRGAHASTGEREIWKARVLQVDESLPSSVLVGWLAQPSGHSSLPGSYSRLLLPEYIVSNRDPVDSGISLLEPLLIVATDNDRQLVTSNTSSALISAALPLKGAEGKAGRLAPGDVLEVHADISRRRAWFRVGPQGPEVEALRLPMQRWSKQSSQEQALDVHVYPFFAVRGKAKIQVLVETAGTMVELRSHSAHTKSIGGGSRAHKIAFLSGPPGAGKSVKAAQLATTTPDFMGAQILGAEWLRHRATFASSCDREEAVSDITSKKLSRPDPPPELHRLLGSDPSLNEMDYWLPQRGWDVQGILDDLRVARSRSHFSEHYASLKQIEVADGIHGLPTLLKESGERPIKVRRRDQHKTFAAVEPDIAMAQRWPLQRARDALVDLLPELIHRAVERGATAIVDDCNLQVSKRSSLRKAMGLACGPSASRLQERWIAVLPHSVAELRRRINSRDPWLLAADERSGATLPGSQDGVSAQLVDGVSGAEATTVFSAWLCGEVNDSGVSDSADVLAVEHKVQRLERCLAEMPGGIMNFLSTEGTRRF